MRRILSRAGAPAVLTCAWMLLSGCSRNYVQSDTTLGRVIVYRNGVAYFERSAVLDDDHLQMTVPDQQLDDFLKSLSVHDAATGELAPVSYKNDSHGSVDLTVKLAGPKPHSITLSYVTEAPAWKPSYRVTLGKAGKVKLQAWAIVDNVSGEDWNGVKLGVSSGSALSFRYDLRSVRNVARDRLEPQGLVAFAPPNGGAVYAGREQTDAGVVASVDDNTLDALEGEEEKAHEPGALLRKIERSEAMVDAQLARARAERDVVKTLCLNDKLKQVGAIKKAFTENQGKGSTAPATLAALAERSDQLMAEANQCIGEEVAFVGESTTVVQAEVTKRDAKKTSPPRGPMGGNAGPISNPPSADDKNRDADGVADAKSPADNAQARLRDLEHRVSELKEQIMRNKLRVHLLSETRLAAGVGDAARRAELLKSRLVRAGIPEDRVVVDARQTANGAGGLRILTEPMSETGLLPNATAPGAEKIDPALLEPVKSSLFEVKQPMDVPSNSSVMLALFAGESAGEAVYYYDPESARGNAMFPFRALRLKNPTGSTLESGPVTVISEGRFLGEGVSDPIPPGGFAFVPFALDRQVVAEHELGEDDAIARIVSVRRGIFETEVAHSRRTHFTFYNRSDTATSLYLRHTPAPGFTPKKAPALVEKIGAANLYRVELPARGKLEVEIVESSPVKRAMDIKSADGAKLLRAYVEGAHADPAVKTAVTGIVAIAGDIGKLEEQLATKRDQQKEFRDRMNELHAQVVTLKTVKSSGRLLAELEKKLSEVSDRVSKITGDIVELEEKIMLGRVRMDDALAELHLDAKPAAPASGSKPAATERAAR